MKILYKSYKTTEVLGSWTTLNESTETSNGNKSEVQTQALRSSMISYGRK